MWEIIVSFFSNILGAVIPSLMSKDKQDPIQIRIDELRFNIAQALSMYACCYLNPVDLAQVKDGILPPLYVEGSHRLRELASQLKGLAETTPANHKKLLYSKSQMLEVAGCLYGISNSFTTPYNCGRSLNDLRNTREYVRVIRTTLNFEQSEE